MGKIIRSHYRIIQRPRPGQTAGSFRIAVLADLHNQVYRSDVPALTSAIDEEHCDAVLSAGDLVVLKHGHFAVDQALALLEHLADRYPVFLANGNHETRMQRLYLSEYLSYEAAVGRLGVVTLHNESADLNLNGVKIRITGLELDYRAFRSKYHLKVTSDDISRLVGNRAKDRFNILLGHHPKYFPAYARWGADLALSGHLHGGIARLPYIGGVISPDPQLFPHYDKGLFRIGASRMVVSAGLGTHTVNLRINNPAELVIIDVTVE